MRSRRVHSSDSLSHCLQLRFSVCIQLHFFLNSPCQHPFIWARVSVCIQLQISLSPAPFSFTGSLLSAATKVSSVSGFSPRFIAHPWCTVFILHFSSSGLFRCDGPTPKYFQYFLPGSPTLSHLSSSILIFSPAPPLSLLLSISICLSGDVGFSQGCTLTRRNGVSLSLLWRQHFAVRVTTPLCRYGQGRKWRARSRCCLAT